MNEWTTWLVVGLIWAGLFPMAFEYLTGLDLLDEVKDWNTRRKAVPLKFDPALTLTTTDTGPLKLPPAGGGSGNVEKDI